MLSRRRMTELVASVGLTAITLGLFAPALGYAFLGWDDTTHLLDNPWLQPPLTWGLLRQFWLQPYFKMYIPVTYSVWAAVVGATANPSLSPAVFHALNMVVHALNSLLVWGVIRRLGIATWPALLGALVFSIHPIQVESVVWISALKDVLSTFFALIGLHVWLRLVVCETSILRWQMCLRLAGAGLCFVLAVLAKPGAVVAPALALILGLQLRARPESGPRRRMSTWLGGIFGCSLALVTMLVTRSVQPLPLSLQPAPLWVRPLLAGDALGFWLAKVLLPINLTPDYGRTPQAVMQEAWFWLIWLLPCGLSLISWRLRRRWPLLALAWVVFLLGCLPNWGLIPFGFQNISTVADRYLYLSMLGVALALAAVAQSWRGRTVILAGLGLGILLGALTLRQMRPWQSTETLFAFMLEHNPESFTAAHGLGYAAHQRGDLAAAVPLYERALRSNPQFADAYTNLATALYQKGELTAAIANFEKALTLAPDDGVTLSNLGLALDKAGRPNEAIERYAAAINLTRSPYAALNLGNLLIARGDMAGAERAFRLATTVLPRMVQAWERLGFLYLQTADAVRAEAAFRQALAVDSQVAKSWFGLAHALRRQNLSSEAEQAFARALALDPEISKLLREDGLDAKQAQPRAIQ